VRVQNSITPLHVAAKWGRKGMVALLLDTGATIDARTRVIIIYGIHPDDSDSLSLSVPLYLSACLV